MSREKLRDVYASMLKNARSRGRDVEITLGDVEAMWDESGGRCALSGIPFDFERRGRKRRPFAPSIDRIDSMKAYTRANCRLVCVAVNYAMSDWGEGVLRQVAHGILGRTGFASSGRLPGTYVRHTGAGIRFEVFLQHAGRRHYLGCFAEEQQAHQHYVEAKAGVRRGASIEHYLVRSNAHQLPSKLGEIGVDTEV